MTSTVAFIVTATDQKLSFYSSLTSHHNPQTIYHDSCIVGLVQISPCSVGVIDERNQVHEYFGITGRHNRIPCQLKTEEHIGFIKFKGVMESIRVGGPTAFFQDE